MSQSAISAGVGSAIDIVQGMLDRAEAEVITLNRWDERKLAYPIEGQKRGTFLHTLFKVNPVQIANIERDCNLSEDVLRVLMTRADYMGETEIEAAKAESQTAHDKVALEAEQADDEETTDESVEAVEENGSKADAEAETAEAAS
jgi:small subunit ribosomal protein S6